MGKVKFFTVCALILGLLVVSSAMAIEKPIKSDEGLVIQKTGSVSGSALARDDDDYMTYRYMKSDDGGVTWGEVMGTGPTGMWNEAGDDQNWSVYDFGSIVDHDNNLHIIGCLTGYEGGDMLGRENGVYDVLANGDESTYTMIAAEGETGAFDWSDAGIDAEGNLYAIWVNDVTPEEGDPYAELWAAKTTDGNWGDPVMLFDGMSPDDNYPHMTEKVGDYFYVLYEMANEESGEWDHYVLKVPASLEGEVINSATGASSGVYYSYYIGAVKAIEQDVDAGYVYFCVRNVDASGTTVGNSDNGVDWTLETITADQRYPSVGLGNDMPWVFSNFGLPDPGDYHKDWYTYDELGYNGGGWVEPMLKDSVLYVGNYLNNLYVHNGVWTPGGDFVTGCNLWGNFTPEGYVVNVWDAEAEAWMGTQRIFNIYEEGAEMVGGFIAQVELVAGMDNTVYITFCGQYGESDFDGPVIHTTDLSSVMLGEEKIVTAHAEDATGVDYEYGLMINWLKDGDGYKWELDFNYDMETDEDGNGIYYLMLPDSVDHWDTDTTFTREALSPGDHVWFYVDGYDAFGNYGYEPENMWVVNESWQGLEYETTAPVRFELGENYPNPFNNSTVIPFSIDRAADISVSVFDLSGRLVTNLFEGHAEAGQHTVAWAGEGMTSGIYFYTLEAAGVRHVGKMTLVR